jgi:hypothetical protein
MYDIDYCEIHESKNHTDLKSTINPYASKIMPKIGHPMTTKKKPTPNEIVPCTTKRGEKTVKRKEAMHITQYVWMCMKVCVCVCVCVSVREILNRFNLKILTFHEELHGRLQSNGQSHP